jgi:hypothetical protein
MVIYFGEHMHTVNTESAFVASKETGLELNVEETKLEFMSGTQNAGQNNNKNNQNL